MANLETVTEQIKNDPTIVDISTIITIDGFKLLINVYNGVKDFHVAQGVNAVVSRLSNGVVLNNKMSIHRLPLAFPEVNYQNDWWIRHSSNHGVVVNLDTEEVISWDKFLLGH